MRILAVLLIVITLLVGGFLGYCYYGAQMQIEGVAATLTPAVDALGTYNDLLEQLEAGTFLGTSFASSDFLMPDSYAFLTLTVRMRNPGFFPMDYLEIKVEPDPSDILQTASDRTPSLRGMSSGALSAVVLTRTGSSKQRGVTVTYYVFGHPFTAKYTY